MRDNMLEDQRALEVIQTLPKHHQIAFGASCCERLIPNYRAFWAVFRSGNPAILEHALDEAWNSCANRNSPVAKFEELMERCKTLAPDSDDFKSAYTQLALHSIGAIWCLLDFCAHDQFEQIITISRLAVDSAEYFSMVANWPTRNSVSPAMTKELEEWVKNSPLVRAELDKQSRDAMLLLEQAELNADFLANFRREGDEVGVDPIERGLVIDYRTE